MRDLLPPDAGRQRQLVEVFRSVFEPAGYREVRTPVLEPLEVFLRVGEGTDVVTKEMYVFEDRDGSTVALRPETTASVMRAFLQHHPGTPWRVWYQSQHFRHEKPQRGRLREHTQVGVEAIGAADPSTDVEVIVGLADFFGRLGLSRVRLLVNSIGEPATRAAYARRLGAFLEDRLADLDPLDRPKVATNPLRVLDSKRAKTQAALEGHPTLLEEMGASERERFDHVLAGLASAGVDAEVTPGLVRGLDYYTHTVFEFVSDALDAAQSTIGAGGRYDGLAEAMGGEPTAGIGFGSGVERVLLACDAEGVFAWEEPAPVAFVVTFGGDGSDAAGLCLELRRAGLEVLRAEAGRSPKAQMKQADRSGARVALLIGDDERASGSVTIRELRGPGGQRSVPRDRLIDELRKLT
jgi:histidyl-tRNA synthetase